jgi:hypothetical protein
MGRPRPTNPTSSAPMLIGQITLAIFHEALRRTPDHKAAGSNGVPGMVLKNMPPAFHEAIHLLFQAMAITGITPPTWLQSHTILLHKKGDPTNMDKNRPITLFPATDHKQLVRVLEFLGIPSDFTRLVSNLYSGATIQFITPHGHTSQVGIRRGTL